MFIQNAAKKQNSSRQEMIVICKIRDKNQFDLRHGSEIFFDKFFLLEQFVAVNFATQELPALYFDRN
jgi:hypothetical protein